MCVYVKFALAFWGYCYWYNFTSLDGHTAKYRTPNISFLGIYKGKAS